MESVVKADQQFSTPNGMIVRRRREAVDGRSAIDAIAADVDTYPGAVLASNFEYPGRYTRWSLGFSRPPLAIYGKEQTLRLAALNARGEVLLAAAADTLAEVAEVEILQREPRLVVCQVRPSAERFTEEERSKQSSVFSALRALVAAFALPDDHCLGFYGAFGYDLVFQFENIERHIPRVPDQRDLVLYLPDEVVVVDLAADVAFRYSYEFGYRGRDTDGLDAEVAGEPYRPASSVERDRDHEPGAFAQVVEQAKESFRRGDLFEVVPGQAFYVPSPQSPSAVFGRIRAANPAPFGALLNLGRQEYLVSGSPEMYVRVEGRRVESCPISGTIRRGADVFGDAEMVRELLNSAKDESELTMCTDVDRNDKSRICVPGSVQVIGRRQIEMYARVIHTVDHVEGQLREGYDAIDAFLTHMWAVTVTGAPKLWAMRFIERHERSPRIWYGGAIGFLGFDGTLNTGLTLRTVHILDGVAQVRAGGTLLIDSDPYAEEVESELKAAAFLEALRVDPDDAGQQLTLPPVAGPVPKVLLLDCEDSFVHTLANYVRQVGAEVRTVRSPMQPGELEQHLDSYRPDLLLLSPGPGRPEDFGVAQAAEAAIQAGVAVFGVCLGLQGIVESFGGRLGLLSYPMHGKASQVRVVDAGGLMAGLPAEFEAGRYHSIFADRATLPAELAVTAETEDGVIMAVEHRTLPVAAVQFHPESIMTAGGNVGLRLIHNVVTRLASRTSRPVGANA